MTITEKFCFSFKVLLFKLGKRYDIIIEICCSPLLTKTVSEAKTLILKSYFCLGCNSVAVYGRMTVAQDLKAVAE